MTFADKVYDVLSDTLNLPEDFLDYVGIQYPAINPISTAKTSGMRIAYATRNANIATAGVTFGTGVDLLTTPIQFTAQGSQNYIFRVNATGWFNTNVAQNQLRMNLDGADNGFLALCTIPAANETMPVIAAGIFTPTVGEHSVNARLTVTAGTGTVQGAGGGAGNALPIVVTLEVA